jgi:hypothetical protein
MDTPALERIPKRVTHVSDKMRDKTNSEKTQ